MCGFVHLWVFDAQLWRFNLAFWVIESLKHGDSDGLNIWLTTFFVQVLIFYDFLSPQSRPCHDLQAYVAHQATMSQRNVLGVPWKPVAIGSLSCSERAGWWKVGLCGNCHHLLYHFYLLLNGGSGKELGLSVYLDMSLLDGELYKELQKSFQSTC